MYVIISGWSQAVGGEGGGANKNNNKLLIASGYPIPPDYAIFLWEGRSLCGVERNSFRILMVTVFLQITVYDIDISRRVSVWARARKRSNK